MAKGIKVAQQGTDVATAADFQLIVSSQWPLMSILAQGSFSLPASAINQTIYEHDLGYVPAFVVFNTGAFQTDASKNANQTGQSEEAINFFFNMDSSKLYVSDSSSYLGAFTGYYIIFKQDLSAVVNPTVAFGVPAQSTGSSNFGLEVAQKGDTIQPGELTSSSSLHPLVIHMQGQIQTDQTGGFNTIVHNLGYLPIIYLYSYVGGVASPLVYRATAQPNSIAIRGVQSVLPVNVAYIIFKDPIFQGDTT